MLQHACIFSSIWRTSDYQLMSKQRAHDSTLLFLRYDPHAGHVWSAAHASAHVKLWHATSGTLAHDVMMPLQETQVVDAVVQKARVWVGTRKPARLFAYQVGAR